MAGVGGSVRCSRCGAQRCAAVEGGVSLAQLRPALVQPPPGPRWAIAGCNGGSGRACGPHVGPGPSLPFRVVVFAVIMLPFCFLHFFLSFSFLSSFSFLCLLLHLYISFLPQV